MILAFQKWQDVLEYQVCSEHQKLETVIATKKTDTQCVCVWDEYERPPVGLLSPWILIRQGGMGVKFSWEERVCSQGDLAGFFAALPFSESP